MWLGSVPFNPMWELFKPDTIEEARVWVSEQVKQLGVRGGVRYELVVWQGTQAGCWFAEIKADNILYARIPGTFDSDAEARARLAGLNVINMHERLIAMAVA